MNIRIYLESSDWALSPKVTTPMATAALTKETPTTLVTNLLAWHPTVTGQHEHVGELRDGNDAYGDQQ
jgi:hypothetical protein